MGRRLGLVAAPAVLLALLIVAVIVAQLSTTAVLLLAAAAVLLAVGVMIALVAGLGLGDAQAPLGLPVGSVRSLLALLVILGFLFLGWQVLVLENSGDLSEGASVLAEQFLTALGTLAIAAAGFYFGTRSVQAAHGAPSAPAPAPAPEVTGISPREGSRGATVTATITGRHFSEDAFVELRSAEHRLNVANVSYVRPTALAAEVAVQDDAPAAQWELVVVNPDGEHDVLARAFRVVSVVGEIDESPR